MNIALTPELAQLIRERVESGRYASASEVVREALRLFAEASDSRGRALMVGDGLEQEARIDREHVRTAAAVLRSLRAGTTLGPALTVRDLIDEGRR